MQETVQGISMTSGEELYLRVLSSGFVGFNISPHSLCILVQL